MKTDNKGIIIPDFLVVMKWIKNEGKCMSDLYRELDISYKHLHELKHTFIILDWIYIKKSGFRHNMYLTDKGYRIVEIAEMLMNEIGIDDFKLHSLLKLSKIKKHETDSQIYEALEKYGDDIVN